MKAAPKLSLLYLLACFSFLLTACSGVKQTSGGGGGGDSATRTISATVSGLSGTGLVLQDNGADNLTVSANGTVTFATAVANNGAYAVTVKTQPSTPSQTCVVVGGSGTATANVMVQVNCSTGTFTVGGQVTGLTGTGLVLQNNGGDNLTVNQTGTFTFGTPVATGSPYSVTVLQQPKNPAQVCTVASGSGTVTASVGNIVVTCSVGTLSVGGSVSGLAGTGLVLQDNGGDNLTISANGTFQFASLIPSGSAYAVTILTQPSGPAQTCTVTGGSGTTTANVTNIQIICPAVFHSIGGQVVGLYVPTGGNASAVLQNQGGDNLPITGNGPFTFVTQIAHGSSYDVSVFVAPSTQPQGCRIYFYQGTALSDVNSVVYDCGHNDWAWIAGAQTANQHGANNPPSATPPTSIVTSTPGGVRYPATWTDNSGKLWLFSGYGYSTNTSASPQPWWFQEMWNYVGTGTANYQGDYVNYWSMVTPTSASVPVGRWGAVTWTDPATGDLWLFGGQDQYTSFLNDLWHYNISTSTWTKVTGGANQSGVYGTQGVASASNFPGGRWGASGKIDASGALWLFGGYGYDSAGASGLLNDLWKYSGGQWTWVSGAKIVNQNGVYGTQGTASVSNVPGGRQASVSWTDASGNFWLFGGYNLSPSGQPNAFNDLWEFSSGQWKWVSGANVVNQTGVYGTQGTAAATNTPGARWSTAAWADQDVSGNTRLWLFGGQGYDATGNGSLADLWVFKGGQWTWVKGPNSVSQKGIYGTAPTPITWPYVGNNPGSRWGSGYWIDNSGELWLFGGEGFDASSGNGNGLLNDLWRYLPFPE
jgi:N-acetylneuraminic acid mutarotase